jgi:hypothetical protein
LWKIENYREFLEERRALLAAEANHRMEDLLHGDLQWLQGATKPVYEQSIVVGAIGTEAEEEELAGINDWVEAQGLTRGVIAYDFADPLTGKQRAVFDLAWPAGIQEELSQPVAVLLNEGSDIVAIASSAGYRCFTSGKELREYVKTEILSSADESTLSAVVTAG